MTRDEAIKEIKRLGDKYEIPCIFFAESASMKDLLDDMRLGSSIRRGFKDTGKVLGDEFYRQLMQ